MNIDRYRGSGKGRIPIQQSIRQCCRLPESLCAGYATRGVARSGWWGWKRYQPPPPDSLPIGSGSLAYVTSFYSMSSSLSNLQHPNLAGSRSVQLQQDTPQPPKCNLKSERYVGDTSRTSFPEGFLNLRRFQNSIFTTRRDENATCLSRGTANGFLQQHSIKSTRCTLQTRSA